RPSTTEVLSFSRLYPSLRPGELIDGTSDPRFREAWAMARAETFAAAGGGHVSIHMSSLRKQGPITTGVRCSESRPALCQKARPRRMGPGACHRAGNSRTRWFAGTTESRDDELMRI